MDDAVNRATTLEHIIELSFGSEYERYDEQVRTLPADLHLVSPLQLGQKVGLTTVLFLVFLFASFAVFSANHTNHFRLFSNNEVIFVDGFETLPLGPDPGILLQNAKISFIANSYMGAWGGLNNYLELAVNASPVAVDINTVPARNGAGGWYWGMGLGQMTSALDRIEAEGDYDTCVFLDGPLDTMRQFADRLFVACEHVVLLADAGGHNPATLAGNYFNATQVTLSNARIMEAEYPDLLVVPTALIFYDLTVNSPVSVPRTDYLFGAHNIHQNGLGTLINAFSMYAMLSSRSPVGIEFVFDGPANGNEKFIIDDEILLGYQFPANFPEDVMVFNESTRRTFQQRILQLLLQWKNFTTVFDSNEQMVDESQW